jgi:glycosyltransferase involved in cell wall biosynthesis
MESSVGSAQEAPAFAPGKAVASIIIPAHNEGAVIGRLLAALPAQVAGGPLQVIVACNGCTDDTADIARAHGASVVEVNTASKIAALNAADSVATAFPRLYVDADIQITPRAVADLIAALMQPGALCAAPPPRLVLDGRPWVVRAYLTFLRELSRARGDFVGAGVYALSQAGRSRFGRFPDVVADDAFVKNSFTPGERRVVATDPTIVQAPKSVRALFRQRIRGTLGNMQLAARPSALPVHVTRMPGVNWWQLAAKRPALVPSALVYSGMNALARIVVMLLHKEGRAVDWGRDETTR